LFRNAEYRPCDIIIVEWWSSRYGLAIVSVGSPWHTTIILARIVKKMIPSAKPYLSANLCPVFPCPLDAQQERRWSACW
jgi:hypothetical protein